MPKPLPERQEQINQQSASALRDLIEMVTNLTEITESQQKQIALLQYQIDVLGAQVQPYYRPMLRGLDVRP